MTMSSETSVFRRLLHDWLPPALSRLLRRVRRGKQEPEWEVAPDGWKTPARGWNVESVATVQARRYDLVIASSSLWYEPDWRSVAGDLARCGDYVYLTRMAFVSKPPSFTAIQRPVRGASYVTEYICWIFNREEFLSYLASCGL